jgi:FMN phosphatase YigB (HAD superfamily)
MPPKIIYFDLGNVLLSFSHARMCRQMADVAGVSPELIRDVLFDANDPSAVQWQYEVGRISTDEYYDYICRRIGCRPDRPRLEHAACDIFQPIAATWELVQALAVQRATAGLSSSAAEDSVVRGSPDPAAGVGPRLAILSNCNHLHWRFVTDGRYSLLRDIGASGSPFSWAVISFEVGSMKPDRRIYDAAIERAGLPPEAIFFVDDRPENVAAARAAGIDAEQFVTAARLRDDLQHRGIDGI